MNYKLLILLIFANIPVYILYGKMIFKDWEDFGEAIGFIFKLPLFAALDGEYWDQRWAGMKLLAWLSLCFITIYLEYTKLGKITGWW
jgi:hypothetical protein